ncbi:MAG: hypothetical protein LUH11_03320, partial [Candidatus Gastranaerophilales bacterium]|nr:hypothetical protein [Candidatus Gastranaerophilales bacterium]
AKESDIRDAQVSNIKPLFYASDDDFALEIYNKDETETMILYLTNSDKSFNEIYNEIYEKTKNSKEYTKKRVEEIIAKNPEKYKDIDKVVNINPFLKVPYLSIDRELNYDKELAGKPIKGKNYETSGEYWEIIKTLQTIKFDLNNEGAKLKSEAAIEAIAKMSVRPDYITINLNDYYYFDRPFIIFLKEINKDKPYFAARIKDGRYLVKSD